MATGIEKVRSAIKGEGGAVPVYPILGAAAVNCINRSVKEYLTDSKIFLESQLTAYELLQQDVITCAADVYIEAEAMGCELQFPENDLCHISRHPLQDQKTRIDALRLPNPAVDGRIPYFMETCRELKKQTESVPVGGGLAGPWSMAANLRRMEKLIVDTMDDPSFVHSLMSLTTQAAQFCGDALLETGASLSYGDATASCDIISPAIYREFIKPYHAQLISYFQEKKAGVTLHICGNTRPILNDVIETRPLAFSIDAKVPLEEAFKIAENRTVIVGNVPTILFLEDDPAPMEQAITSCLNEARQQRFFLCSGCEVPVNASWESMKNYMRLARKHTQGT